jgi:hypothetical protein
MNASWCSIRAASFVLAAYGLVVAMGLVSPMLAQGEAQIVCLGGGGVKLTAMGEDSSEQATSSTSMACPLCQTWVPPPILAVSPPPPVSSLAYAAAPGVVARLHALAGAPLPARGPPQS